jgi:hypothetical protein
VCNNNNNNNNKSGMTSFGSVLFSQRSRISVILSVFIEFLAFAVVIFLDHVVRFVSVNVIFHFLVTFESGMFGFCVFSFVLHCHMFVGRVY